MGFWAQIKFLTEGDSILTLSSRLFPLSFSAYASVCVSINGARVHELYESEHDAHVHVYGESGHDINARDCVNVQARDHGCVRGCIPQPEVHESDLLLHAVP
jgi:hypothetical protein